MADTTRFELVSPERLLVSRDVGMVVVPGAEGLFGVLPRHAPLISTLIPGVIDIWEDGAITEQIFVDGGFAEVTETRCTVLAEQATPVADLDPDGFERQIDNLREEQKNLTGDDVERVEARIRTMTGVLDAMRRATASST